MVSLIKRYWKKGMRELWEGNRMKYYYWLLVELAVLEAREKLGQIPKGVTGRIREKFEGLLARELDSREWLVLWSKIVSAIERRDRVLEHDLNAFIEIMRIMIILPSMEFWNIIHCENDKEFNQRVSEALAKGKDNADAGLFHDGMTSYDTEEAAMAMLYRDSYEVIHDDLKELQMALLERAKKHCGQIMIGRTHGQHAQPITFGIKCLNWFEMIQRAQKNMVRVAMEYEVMKLSGAVGVYGTLGPEVEQEVGKILGGLKPVIATQIVSISYRARIISEMAILSQELRKIANDLWLMMQTEVGEAREHFTEKQKGSSAMMHKKNPIRTERVRGLASLLLGYSVSMNDIIATSHERDISHSSAERLIAMDAFGILDYQIQLLTEIIQKMNIFPERMLENLEMTYGTIASQKLEMLLKEKGIPAEEAYRTVQEICFEAMKQRRHLREFIELTRCASELMKAGKLSRNEIEAVFDWKEWVKEEDHIYKNAGL